MGFSLLIAAGSATGEETVVVKFAEGSGVRLADGARLTSRTADVSLAQAVLDSHPGVEMKRVFSRPVEELEADRERVLQLGKARLAVDLTLFFKVRFETKSEALAFVARMRDLPLVQTAYLRQPVGLPTVDLQPGQGYLEDSFSGTGAEVAWNSTGAKGGSVTIADIEYCWHTEHEDLSGAPAWRILTPPGRTAVCEDDDDPPGNATTRDLRDHGTAVLGEMIADDNNAGVLGIAHEADVLMVPPRHCERGTFGGCVDTEFDVADAINRVAAVLQTGDVILIELQHADGTPIETCRGCWPSDVFGAIYGATQQGLVVVEPAGNGRIVGTKRLGWDLDDETEFGTQFALDSGAIFVGAGYPDPDQMVCSSHVSSWGEEAARSKLPFSCYGSRLDVQGWGASVVTTGTGDHYQSPSGNESAAYTHCFSGTSSASPMVAAGAAAVQGRRKHLGRPVLSPGEMRALLNATGKPQTSSSTFPEADYPIGPLVDIKAAVEAAGDPPTINAVTVASVMGCAGFPTRQVVTIEGSGFIPIAKVFLNDGSQDYPIDEDRTDVESSTEITICAGVAQAPSWTARVVNIADMVSNSFPFSGGSGGGSGPPTVTTLAASNISQGAASLNMTVDPNGSATNAWFDWGGTAGLGSPPTPAEPVGAGSSPIAYSRTISGLDCGEDYFFRARASSGEGSATPGATLSLTTDSCTGGGGTQDEELIRNGGFEDDDAFWVRSGDFYADRRFDNYHWDVGYAYLSEPDGSPGNGLNGWISQGFTIPAAATSVSARFWYNITTQEPSTTEAFDTLTVEFYEVGNNNPYEVVVLSNLDDTGGSYEPFTFDLSSFAGETIQLYFTGVTDYYAPNPALSYPTVFRIDDVSVEAEVPAGDPPVVATVAADQITSSTARLNMTVDPGGLQTDVWFEWDDDTNLSFDTDREDIGAGTGTESYSYTLTNLDCEDRYYFKAFAENQLDADEGVRLQFDTGACPGGPPTADTDPAIDITRHSAVLKAEIRPNGLSTDAWFEWGTTDALGLETPRDGVGSSYGWVPFEETLVGLSCGTTYFFEAWAENSADRDDGTTHEFTTIACDPGNQAPLAGTDAYFTPVDSPLAVPAPGVLGNDTDPEEDPLTAHLIDPPGDGQVTLNADGSFSYSPDPGFEGTDTFTYVANDGLLDSAVTGVSVSVGTAPPILWPDLIDLDTSPGTEPVPVTRVYGNLPQASFTRHVATGDFNNDGFADLLIGAEDAEPMMRDEAGAAYVVWGSAALPNIAEMKVDQGGITSIYGLVDDNLGSCVAAGDIDNDGFDDLVIGSDRYENGTVRRTGKVQVIYGQASLPAVIDMEATLVEKTDILGPAADHFMGRSCAVGDLDNDGFDDVLAGANTTDFGELNDVGKHFVILGSASLGGVINLRDVGADMELWGAGDNDELGRAVTSGDLNDDGFDDLILSGSGTTGRQHVYVLWGKSSLPSFQDLSVSLAGITKILGPPQGSYGISFGRPVTTGDVDNDGIADLIASGLGSEVLCPSDCGAVFVIYGTPALSGMATLDLGVTPGTEAVDVTRLHGVAQDSFLGSCVATGDFNRDGQTDLVAGASGFGERETVYAIPGRPELRAFVESPIDNEAFEATRIRSPVTGVSMGIDCAVGDANGDDYGDLMLGAHRISTADGTNVGAGFIVYGGVRTLSSPYRTLTVNVVGNGGGTVSSTPAGMSCTGQCQADYFYGSSLDLDATPDAGVSFDRWIGGGCGGNGTCSLSIDRDMTVAGLFVEADACGEADVLHLYGMRIEGAETFEACSHLTVGDGFTVESTGSAILRSGGGVTLESGTAIEGGLAVETDAPDLAALLD